MKKTLNVLLYMALGALLMYLALWYQVYGSFERAWCQISHAERHEKFEQRCKDYGF